MVKKAVQSILGVPPICNRKYDTTNLNSGRSSGTPLAIVLTHAVRKPRQHVACNGYKLVCGSLLSRSTHHLVGVVRTLRRLVQ